MGQRVQVHFFHRLVTAGLEQIHYCLAIGLRPHFQQHSLVLKVALRQRLQHLAHCLEKQFLAYLHSGAHLLHHAPDANQARHSFLSQQFAESRIRKRVGPTIYVAKYHGSVLCAYRTPQHKVERGSKRTEVAAIAIDYDCAVVHAFYHVGARIYGLQPLHSLGQTLAGYAHLLGAGGTQGGIGLEHSLSGQYRAILSGRDITLQRIRSRVVEGLNKQRIVVGGKHRRGANGQFHLLGNLFAVGFKTLIVLGAYIGHYHHSGTYHFLQFLHLAVCGDSGFYYGKIVLVAHLPHRQRYAYLRIVTSRRAHHLVIILEQSIEPLFHDGLTLASGNRYHRHVESTAVICGYLLQGRQWATHHYEIGIGLTGRYIFALHHKVPHSTLIKLVHEIMPIALTGVEGKKQCLLRGRQRPRVGKQRAYHCLPGAPLHSGAFEYAYYFFYFVFHCLLSV